MTGLLRNTATWFAIAVGVGVSLPALAAQEAPEAADLIATFLAAGGGEHFRGYLREIRADRGQHGEPADDRAHHP